MENQQSNKKPIYKRIWFISVVGIIFLTSAAAVIVLQKDKEEITVYIPITVNEMLKDYNSDETSADRIYKDKHFEITGTVDSVNTVPYQTCIILKSTEDDTINITVQCFIQNPDQRSKASNLEEGDKVTLKGKCTGFTYHVSVDNCTLVI